MADTPNPAAPATSPGSEAAAPAKPAAALRKGALVRLNLATYQGSLEAGASDPSPPAYLLEGPAEILAVKGEHAQLRLRRPVPDVWLRLDQLEPYPA
jgi:hypothetical protein